MSEQHSPAEATVAKGDERKGPRAIGMYDRPTNAGRPAPFVLIGIVVLLALLVFAAYSFLF
jgi:hypothetical protein